MLYHASYVRTTDGPQAIFLLAPVKEPRKLLDPKEAGLLDDMKIEYICEVSIIHVTYYAIS